MIRIDPPLPVFCPGRGPGWAHFLLDYGPETHLHWVIFLDDGQIWTLPNPAVRAQWNRTTLNPQPCRPQ